MTWIGIGPLPSSARRLPALAATATGRRPTANSAVEVTGWSIAGAAKRARTSCTPFSSPAPALTRTSLSPAGDSVALASTSRNVGSGRPARVDSAARSGASTVTETSEPAP